MYKDVRAAVDLCHRDGTLKEMVALDPKRYNIFKAICVVDVDLIDYILIYIYIYVCVSNICIMKI